MYIHTSIRTQMECVCMLYSCFLSYKHVANMCNLFSSDTLSPQTYPRRHRTNSGYGQERNLHKHVNTVEVTNLERSVTKDPSWSSLVWQVIFARCANSQPSTHGGRCNAQT